MAKPHATSGNRLRTARTGEFSTREQSAPYYGDGPIDPRLPLYTDTCRCTGCGEYFNSPAAFDKHRVGEPGIDRRCWTPAEMRAHGMSKNDRDLWVTKAYVPGIHRDGGAT